MSGRGRPHHGKQSKAPPGAVTRSRSGQSERVSESSRTTSTPANITKSTSERSASAESERDSTRTLARHQRYDASRSNLSLSQAPPGAPAGHKVVHSPISVLHQQYAPPAQAERVPETPADASSHEYPPATAGLPRPANNAPVAPEDVAPPKGRPQGTTAASSAPQGQQPEPVPEANATSTPNRRPRSRAGSSITSQGRAYRLAKAREELAAAKLATIEAEAPSDEEEDSISASTEVSQRVEKWIDRSEHLAAIDFHAHNPSPPQGEVLPIPAGAPGPPSHPQAAGDTHPPAPRLAAAAPLNHAAPVFTPSPPAGDKFAIQPYTPSTDIALLTEAIRTAILAGKDSPTRRPADLPTFQGSRRQWISFKKVFTDTAPYFTAGENTARLQAATQSLRNTALGEFILAGAAPELIMEKLEESYGNKATLAALEYRNLRDLPRLTDNAQDICSFSIKLGTIMSTLQLVDPDTSRYNSEILRSLHDKLTINLQSKWYSYSADKPRRENDVMLMVSFMQEEARLREPYTIMNDTNYYKPNAQTSRPQYSQQSKPYSQPPKQQYNTPRPAYAQARAASYAPAARATTGPAQQPKYQKTNTAMETQEKCPICESDTHVSGGECAKFLDMCKDKRREVVKRKNLCFKCLSYRSKKHTCKRQVCSADNCGKNHNVLVHIDNNISDHAVTTEKVSCAWAATAQSYLKILPVEVSGPLGRRPAWALLDDGSTVSLISQELADAVGAPGPIEPLHIEALTSGTLDSSSSRRVRIELVGADAAHKIEARTVSKLSLSPQEVSEAVINQCEHLRDIKQHLVYKSARPNILIGQDNYQLLLAESVRRGRCDQPIASRSPLGWVLHGAQTRSLGHRVNFISTVEEKLEHFFNVDSLAIVPARPTSDPEERAARILEQTTQRVSEKEFEVGLLWAQDKVHLPYNFNLALKRLHSVEKRLDKEPELRAKYEAEMSALVEKGYAEIVQSTGPPGKTFFLPHFPVLNAMKPGKLRIVHDAAARAQGTSLNDKLLAGPGLLQSLPGVLCKFRQHNIAVSADIKEMFMRVLVRPEDRDVLRYLWRGSQRGETPPTEYRMTRLIFGAKNSPACAIYVKNENAKRYENTEPTAVNAIIKKHYVDDYLDSFPDLAQAIETTTKVRDIQAEGNFELRGWKSNSPALMTALGENAPPTDTSVNLDEGPGATERVLGLIWRPSTDELTFNLDLARLPVDVLHNNRPTKREALKIVMSLYDPLGYAAPITVRAKSILQESWRRGLTWDQRFPDDLSTIWADWVKSLLALRNVAIPRCYPGFTHAANTQLHVFTDASQEAYAAALYWRTTSVTGEVNVSLIMAKARVCPLKLHSVPRLEILGAVMGARMAQVVKEEHERQPDSTTFWTDSKTVLQWVRNGSRSYKPFVAHRIAAIQEHSKVSEWRYIPTKLNVADDATRNTPRDFASRHRWYTGPEYLRKPENEWPQYLPEEDEATPTGEERTCVAVATKKYDLTQALPEASRFSKWERYLRSTARVLQFIELCKKKESINYKRTRANAKTDPDWRAKALKQQRVKLRKIFTPSVDRYEPLSTDLLRRATNLIWRGVQLSAFKDDIAALKNNEKRNGKLKSLAVQITDDVITLVSRIDAAEDTQLEKNPIVLDGRHPATRLYIDFIHRKLHHARIETVINEVRQQYWVLHLRPATRQVAHACRQCTKRRALPPTPPTGNHPYMRLAHHKRAYTYTGWDFFGPYTVTVGRSTQKRYVALFTCLTTRGVHLEVAASLSTDSAIAALRRFIARRGCPTEIWSDNGTNLRGADKELRRALETGVNIAATQRGISWRFIPPGSPFMGGAWERMVSSVKKALAAILNERHPSEETLSTFLAEAEFSVNSRPLTHVAVDPNEPTAITPNHFTIGPAAWNPAPGTFDERDTVGRATWRTAQRLADMFWTRWLREYLPQLQNRRDPTHKGPIIAIDDVVLVMDNTLPRNVWPMGVVTALYPGEDGVTRVVDIRTKGGTLRRPTKKLVIMQTMPDTQPGPHGAPAPSAGALTPGPHGAPAPSAGALTPGPHGAPAPLTSAQPDPPSGPQRAPAPSAGAPASSPTSTPAHSQCAPTPSLQLSNQRATPSKLSPSIEPAQQTRASSTTSSTRVPGLATNGASGGRMCRTSTN